jgi:hypothetical protein
MELLKSKLHKIKPVLISPLRWKKGRKRERVSR